MTANVKDLGVFPPGFSSTSCFSFINLLNSTGVFVPTVVGSDLVTRTSSMAMTVGNRPEDHCHLLCLMPQVTDTYLFIRSSR
jgi:hypothetical protein